MKGTVEVRVADNLYTLIFFKMTNKSMDKAPPMNTQSLTEHLTELRSCLIYSLAAVAIGFGAAYAYIQPIADWFFRPLVQVLPKGKSLIFISYQEGFFFI